MTEPLSDVAAQLLPLRVICVGCKNELTRILEKEPKFTSDEPPRLINRVSLSVFSGDVVAPPMICHLPVIASAVAGSNF